MTLQDNYWLCCNELKEPEGIFTCGERNNFTVKNCIYCQHLLCERCEEKEDGKASLGVGKSLLGIGGPVIASKDLEQNAFQGCGSGRSVITSKDQNQDTSQGYRIGRPIISSEDYKQDVF